MSFILGATFDENAVPKGQDQEILERLSGEGFRSLELALHPQALELERAVAIKTISRHLGFSFAFHVPDFAEPVAFDLNYIMAPEGSRSAFKAWMDQCGDFGEEVQLIFHGAATEADTLRFVDFALEWIEKSRGSQVLLLENTFAKSTEASRFGHTADALLKVIRSFSGSRLGLCLDTAHWLRTFNHGVFPMTLEKECDSSLSASNFESEGFKIPDLLLREVRRVHVHSVEPLSGRDHQGLTLRDEATALLLKPWTSSKASWADPVRGDCILSVEVLASSLFESHETAWLDAVLTSGAWLKGSDEDMRAGFIHRGY